MKALAIKYRPSTFDDVTEQTAVVDILTEQLKTKAFRNGYIFTGGAGTGKTTNARIFANMLNGGKGTPIEIDAASNNGVDNVRDIIEDSKFKSLDSPYKVYIIDECHMLSIGAWNAMLKLLEEPPADTIFIFCTTDPQKVPNTILSRVQRYDFQRISHNGIVARLNYILEQEGFTDYTQDAVEYIAQLADGGMRDAITLLDKCLTHAKTLDIATVIKTIGTVAYDDMFEVLNSLLDKDKQSVIQVINRIFMSGADLKQFITQFLYFLVDFSKYDILGESAFSFIKIPKTFADDLSEYTAEDFQRALELLTVTRALVNDIKWASNVKPVIEATLLVECL